MCLRVRRLHSLCKSLHRVMLPTGAKQHKGPLLPYSVAAGTLFGKVCIKMGNEKWGSSDKHISETSPGATLNTDMIRQPFEGKICRITTFKCLKIHCCDGFQFVVRFSNLKCVQETQKFAILIKVTVTESVFTFKH